MKIKGSKYVTHGNIDNKVYNPARLYEYCIVEYCKAYVIEEAERLYNVPLDRLLCEVIT